MPRVLVPIATGFEEIEALTIIDVLRRAQIEVITAGLEKKCVLGAHGVEIKTEIHIDDVSSVGFDMIVLPGGMPGALHLANNKKVQELLGEMDQNAKYIGAICAAPMALFKAGVLKNSYTCYPSFEEKIHASKYIATEDVVSDQNIITSRGPGTAMQFSLTLVEKLCGEEMANSIRAELLL
jgi:4-methyl-5(b-hydroxyethyl)-thiazole monophosphate biosynthesis